MRPATRCSWPSKRLPLFYGGTLESDGVFLKPEFLPKGLYRLSDPVQLRGDAPPMCYPRPFRSAPGGAVLSLTPPAGQGCVAHGTQTGFRRRAFGF